ncbi:MAG TPA: polysaccharide biosynthesis/export family protein [Opitutaceae bacterium]|nr:polysaccharide biosynthesis/export family protein [Opitutaceae bacterium]
MHVSRRVGLISLVVLLGFAAGCETPRVTNRGTANPQIPVPASNAQLRPGDSLNIALQGVPDASSNNVQIDDQGLISLPFIGTLSAAGASTAELSQRIRETYISKKIYTTVDVSVSVTERFVYVGGEVQRPGRIVWTPDLTAAKAIQSAGGFSLYAKETAVNLVRENNAYTIDVKLAQKNPGQDPRLVPGDSLQVSRSPF